VAQSGVVVRDRLIEPLTPPRAGPARPRWFLVSGGGGHVAPFAPVVRLLEARWEAIGVLDQALFDEEPPIARIEDLAVRMAAAVRSVDPEGPWILAGYSAGGTPTARAAVMLP
jgi:thioesterase domain-containing protein